MKNNQVEVQLSTDIKKDSVKPIGIKLMSRDINNNQFVLRFKSNGERLSLSDGYTVEVLSHFVKSKTETLTTAKVYDNYAKWAFDTRFITQDDRVYNYVYVKKDGVTIVSADANAFYFEVGLSKIDEGAREVAKYYDGNYEQVLHEFEVAINLTKDEWAQMADEARNFVDEIKGVTVDQLVELKMGEELQNLEVNYATRLTGLESNDANLTAQLAQKVGMGKKAELQDLSSTVLSAIEGGVGTSFELLSEPAIGSVTPSKLDYGTGKLLNIKKMTYDNLNYEIGSLGGTGIPVSATTRIRSKMFNLNGKALVELFEDDFQFNVYIYDDTETLVSSTGWLTDNCYIEGNKAIVLIAHIGYRDVGAEGFETVETGARKVNIHIGEDFNSSSIADKSITATKLGDDVGLYGTERLSFILGNTTGTGTFQVASKTITSPDLVRVYEGESLILKASTVESSRIVQIAYFNLDGTFINRTPPYATMATDREIAFIVDGFIKVNVSHSIPGTPIESSDVTDDVYLYVNKLNRIQNNNRDTGYQTAVPLELELGLIQRNSSTVYTGPGRIKGTDDVLATDNAFSGKRTGKYLKVIGGTDFKLNFPNGDAYVYEFDEKFNYISNEKVLTDVEYNFSSGGAYIKICFENLTESHISAVINISTVNGHAEWVFNDFKPNRGSDNLTFLYEVNVNTGRDIMSNASTEEQYTTDKYFNSGVLKMPPNYSPFGEPVPLIIWAQGSGGYGTIKSHSIDLGYEPHFKYLTDEGYAVLGVFPWTSKYPEATYANPGSPTSIYAYNQAYEWVKKNFNVQSDVYLSGKSSGGMVGTILPYFKSIPIRATGLLAPAMSPIREPFGASEASRWAYADDFGFEGDHSVLAEQAGTPAVKRTPELLDYLRLNGQKILGYSGFWNGLFLENTADIIENGATRQEYDWESHKDKKRFFPTPLKIWAAEDDDRGMVWEYSRLMIHTIKNAQGNAELRKMPTGTGGHNATDSAPEALKVASIVTKLGIIKTDVPLAFVELVSWFRRFGN